VQPRLPMMEAKIPQAIALCHPVRSIERVDDLGQPWSSGLLQGPLSGARQRPAEEQNQLSDGQGQVCTGRCTHFIQNITTFIVTQLRV